MKHDLKFPARCAPMDAQEMADITGGASVLGTVTDLVVGVVAGCGIVITSVASAALTITGWAVGALNQCFKALAKL